MSENTVVENVETVEETVAPVYTGLAALVFAQVEALNGVLSKAVALESGLTTQAAIKNHALDIRKGLLAASKGLHALRSDVMDVKDTLLGSVSEVQEAAKKEALLAKKAEIEAMLASM